MVCHAKPTASLHGLNCFHTLGTKCFVLGSTTVQLWTVPACFLWLLFDFFLYKFLLRVSSLGFLPEQRRRIELQGDSFLSLSHLAASPSLAPAFFQSLRVWVSQARINPYPGQEEDSPVAPYSAAFAAGSRDVSDPTGTERMGKDGIPWLSTALLVFPLKPSPKDS